MKKILTVLFPFIFFTLLSCNPPLSTPTILTQVEIWNNSSAFRIRGLVLDAKDYILPEDQEYKPPIEYNQRIIKYFPVETNFDIGLYLTEISTGEKYYVIRSGRNYLLRNKNYLLTFYSPGPPGNHIFTWTIEEKK